MVISDLFTRGLHRLDLNQLLKLADSQPVLLNELSNRELVYLVQELASRIEDIRDQLTPADEVADEIAIHGSEYNG